MFLSLFLERKEVIEEETRSKLCSWVLLGRKLERKEVIEEGKCECVLLITLSAQIWGENESLPFFASFLFF